MSYANLDWEADFLQKLLAVYVRYPKTLFSILEPYRFNHPVFLDIARLTKEHYEKYGLECILSKATLKHIVKSYLGKKRKEIWPTYRRTIRLLFADGLWDKEAVINEAAKYIRHDTYRQALLDTEKKLNRGDYEGARRIWEKVRQAEQGELKADGQALKLPSYHLHQFLSRDENDASEEDHLVFPIVPRSGAVLLYGLPKELKSWFAVALAVDVAFGRNALGYFPVSRAAKTLFVQVEDPEFLTRQRIKQVTAGQDFRKLVGLGMLKVVPRCPLNLTDPVWIGALEEELRGFKPELVVLDVLRRLFRGNVADSKETAEFLQILDRLRDTFHCAIVLVHHARKTESSAIQSMALGSVNLTAWGDVLIYTNGKRQVGNASVADLQIETKSSLPAESELEIFVDSEFEPMVRVQAKARTMLSDCKNSSRKCPASCRSSFKQNQEFPRSGCGKS